MSEPCKNCDRADCPTLTHKERIVTVKVVGSTHVYSTNLADDANDCRAHTVNWRARALAAEKQLATLAESVDAIVKERDALRGMVGRVRDLHSDLLAHSKGAVVSTSLIWTNHAYSVVAKDLAAILNDKETP